MKTPRFRLVGGAGDGAGERAEDSLARIECTRCQVTVTPKVYWRGMHLCGECPSCGDWLKWLPQQHPWLSLAAPEDTQEGEGAQASLFGGVV